MRKNDPVVQYAKDTAKAVGRMGKEIDRCNKLHRRKIDKAVERFTADIEKIRAKYVRKT